MVTNPKKTTNVFPPSIKSDSVIEKIYKSKVVIRIIKGEMKRNNLCPFPLTTIFKIRPDMKKEVIKKSIRIIESFTPLNTQISGLNTVNPFWYMSQRVSLKLLK
ncbi:MAG: hypothetical protein JXB49_13745 [Bacteroidales bacterium]|nr:hypothetical protein [Bacteroidales bacterium]